MQKELNEFFQLKCRSLLFEKDNYDKILGTKEKRKTFVTVSELISVL